MPRVLAAVAAFELRQQLRSGVFVVVFLLSFAMVLGSVSVDQLRVGLCDVGPRNGPEAIVRTHLVWTLFFLFTCAAFVADSVLRDDLTGFGQIIWTTPLRRSDYLLGRFAGSFGAVVACFASVPLGLMFGTVMPWVNQATVGPLEPAAFAFAFLVLALPNLFLGSAVAFGLATAFRSLGAAFLGAVVLLVLYGLGARQGFVPLSSTILEPFGFASFDQAGVSGCLAIGRAVHFSPVLIANRALWCGVGAVLVTLSFRRPVERLRGTARAADAEDSGSPSGLSTVRPARPRFGWKTTLAQLQARVRLEFDAVIRTEAFLALLLLGMANAAASLWMLHQPTTETAIVALFAAFRILPTVVVLFFSGELVWREHERNLAGLVGASPASAAVLAAPKLLALFLVLAGLAAAGAVAGVLIQSMRGISVDLSAYLSDWLWPATFDWCLVAVLATFLQVLAPSKLAGWGLTVLFLIASLVADRLGFTDPRYRFGQHPGWPLPPDLSGAQSVGLFRIYWGSASLCLAVVGAALVGRTPEPLAARLRGLPARLNGKAGIVLAGALLTFICVGFTLH